MEVHLRLGRADHDGWSAVFGQNLFSALRRRWWLAMLGLIVTSAATMAAFVVIPPKYEASASVLLLPSATTLSGTVNPYLQLGGVNNVRDVLTQRLTSDVGNALGSQSPIEVTIQPDPTTSGPIMVVAVQAPTAKEATDKLTEVLGKVPPTLEELQSSVEVPRNQMVSSLVVARPAELTNIEQTRKRATVVVGVVGLLGTVYGALVLDRLLVARRSRRDTLPVEGEPDTTRPAIESLPEPTDAEKV